MRKSPTKASLAGTAAMLAIVFAVPVTAQDIVAPDQSDEAGAADTAIVVTGSRIARPDLEGAMPVSVVSVADAEKYGVATVYDALTREPAVATGVGQANSQGQNFDGGISAVSLRNLGTNRTLTLVDGRRRVSGSARTSAVDLNMIPAGMIERVEVVTGGAAAIYGADAVTGAVNIITKKSIDGLHLNATQGISQRGDASNLSVSLTGGMQSANGRASLVIGGTYVKSSGLYSEDRDFGRSRILFQTNKDNTSLSDGIADRVVYYDWGEFYYNNYPTFVRNNVNYGYVDGTVRELFIQTPINSRGEFYGGDGGFVSDIRPLTEGDQLRSPLETAAINAQFTYEFSDSLTSVTRFDYGKSRYEGTKTFYREDSRANWLNGAGSSFAYLDNPYLPAPLRDFMTGNGLTSVRMSRAFKEFGLLKDIHNRDTFTFSQTLEGELGSGLRWEAFGQYGRSTDNISNPNTLRASRWIAARDVIADPVSGQPVCRDVAARAAGCVPYNIFSNDIPDTAQTAWMFAERNERRVNTQRVFGASITGPALTLPYGDLSFALGVEQRKETLKTRDDPLATPGELAHGAAISRHADIDASVSVAEVYGEVVIPILRDLPFARQLELEGAYRYSDYNTFGGTHTWKGGLTWSPVEGVSFRGVRSRSVRTPNFGELYEPVNTAFSNLSDPCENPYFYTSPTRTANCQAFGIQTPPGNSVSLTAVTSGGNINLKPETSNSVTLGMVVQPRFLPGFDLTVDYWSIDIDDVITQFSAQQITEYCVDLPTIDNIFCSQQTRDQNDPVRALATVSTQQVNASRLQAEGIDLGVRYRRALGDGQIEVSLRGTYLIRKEVEAVPGIESSIVKQVTGYNDPRVRGTLTVNYAIDGFSFGVSNRFVGSALYDANAASDESYSDNTVPARLYTDLALGFDINENYGFNLGVSNVSDVMPPYMPGTYTGANGRYDVVGRYFFAGVKAKF